MRKDGLARTLLGTMDSATGKAKGESKILGTSNMCHFFGSKYSLDRIHSRLQSMGLPWLECVRVPWSVMRSFQNTQEIHPSFNVTWIKWASRAASSRSVGRLVFEFQ